MNAATAELYRRTFEHVWALEMVPAPAMLAAWMERQTWQHPHPDLAVLVDRLRRWPAGRRYPLIPDDYALEGGTSDDCRWWEPGALRGDVPSEGQPHLTIR